ncbi:MAG: hypothetical protein LBT40_04200 [Deltaproteobacteria bacterium]|nr:hypothetical protein [Deltaproteobacteria bacterium]
MSGGSRIPFPALVAALALLAALIAVVVISKGRAPEGGGARPAPQRSPVVRDSSYGSYSSSALGHEAFYEVLREHRPQVERRLVDAPLPSGPLAGLVLADTEAFLGSGKNASELGEFRGRVLAVLPKWVVRRDQFKSGWVKEARLPYTTHDYVLRTLLEAAGGDGKESSPGPDGPGGPRLVTANPQQSFGINDLGVVPDFGGNPVQLLSPEGLRPVVASRDGVLVGELLRTDGPRIWLVSDPDITSNHGIVRGQNLLFAIRLADLWSLDLPRTATITFDESHLPRRGSGGGRGGFLPRLLLNLTSPETGPILLAFLAALLLLLFGMKRMWPEERQPEMSFGKAGLIANTALILERGPMRKDLFRRYMDSVVNSAARGLKAPPAARRDRQALVAWLDARSPSRGPWSLVKLAAEAERELSLPAPSASRLLFFAGRLHLWKEEAEIGPGTGGKNNGRGARRGR